MALSRRSFFGVLGVTGMALAVGKPTFGAENRKNPGEFRGMLYDAARCKGCRGCEWDCADAHGFKEPPPTANLPAVRTTDETCNTVVNTFKTSRGEVYVKRQCMHCTDPACVAACLTRAMQKQPDGTVTWNGDRCMGCRYCMLSCPFDSPKFEYHSANPEIRKCDMCFTRVKEGDIPACAFNCPNEALMYGPRRELLAEARKRIVENPAQYFDHIYGEHEAGGTGWLYLSPVPFSELGLNTRLQHSSYPALTKGFLYSVPSVFVLVPALLAGIKQATHDKTNMEESGDE